MVPAILEPGTGHVTRWRGHDPQSVLGIWADTLCVLVLPNSGIQESSIVYAFKILFIIVSNILKNILY